MVLANPKHVLVEMWRQFRGALRKNEYTDEYQRQLLMLLYELLELVQDGGLKVLDEHIEVPESSSLFQKYPLILLDKDLVTFISDNFRLMAMGKINEHELEGILEQELGAMEEELCCLHVLCSVPQKRCLVLVFAPPFLGSSSPWNLSMVRLRSSVSKLQRH